MSSRKIRIFYGWFIVAALWIIWTVVGGIASIGFTSFIEPLTHKFGWNYTQITFGASLRSLMMVIFAPIGGLLSDRWGARKLIFTGITFFGIGLFLLYLIDSLTHFYLCSILIGIGYSISTGAVPQAVIGRWFRKKMSLATGILMVSGGAAGLMVPLVTIAIDIYGWQTAMAILGIGFWILLTPLSLIIRQSPEQYGYLPNGETKEETVSGQSYDHVPDTVVDTGARQFIKNRVFWHITVALSLHMLLSTAVIVHSMPYLSTIGIDRTTSSFVSGALSIVGVFGRLGFGWFGDKLNKKWMAASGTTMIGLSLIIFGCITTPSIWMLLPAVILFGTGYGGTVTLHPVLLRENFGTMNIGAVIGLSVGITAIGMIAGPPLTSWLFESFGSYRITWFILIGVVIISIISQLTNPSVHTMMQKSGSGTNDK
jgi:MFS family permease